MGQSGQHERPVIRRDAEGRAHSAASWESLTERLIREAQDDGAFDGLPGHGRPLPLDDDRYAGDMAGANRLLKNAGAAPPWIEVDKVVRQQLAAIDALMARASRSSPSARGRLTRELEALADTHDVAATQLETLAPTPRQHRTRLDRAALATRLESALRRR